MDDAGGCRSERTLSWASATVLLILTALTSGACSQRRNFAPAAQRPVRVRENVARTWRRPYPTWSQERRASRALPPCTAPVYIGPVGGIRVLDGVATITHRPCRGVVIMEAEARPDGSAGRVKVLRGLNDVCDAIARRAAAKWQWAPRYWAGGPADAPNGTCSFLPGDPLTVVSTITVTFRAPDRAAEEGPGGRPAR